MSITWTDNVTPLNAVNMNLLEQTVRKGAANGYVGFDSARNISLPGYVASSAAGGVAFASAQGGDTANRFLVDSNGRINWGPGNAAADTNLYRAVAGALKTDGVLYTGGNIFANQGKAAQIILADYQAAGTAMILFSTAQDTNLYRSGAGNLKTDGTLTAGGSLQAGAHLVAQQHVFVDQANGGGKLLFGSALDTNLYRSAASTLKTDGALFTGSQVWAMQGTANQVVLGSNVSGLSPGIAFGNPVDTNLYRSAAGQLSTSGDLKVRSGGPAQIFLMDNGSGASTIYFGSAQADYLYHPAAGTLNTNCTFQVASLTSNGNVVANNAAAGQIMMYSDGKLYFGTANDTSLYRSAAQSLKTDGHLYLGLNLFLANNASAIYFGSANDTNLYRVAASQLKTDGHLSAGIALWANHANANMVAIGWDGNVAKSQITFGQSYDTNLYRSAAGALKTDGTFEAAGGITDNTLPGRLRREAAASSVVSDWNQAVVSGWYAASGAANAPPSPNYNYWEVMVTAWDAANHCAQLAFSLFETNNPVYYRNRVSGNWTAWQQISTSSAASTGPSGIALTNGWQNYPAYNGATSSRTGLVTILDGLIYKPSNSCTPGETVGNVVGGHRPQAQSIGMGRTTGGIAELEVHGDGNIILRAWSGNPSDGSGNGWMSLTGFVYPAYQ